MDMCRRARAEKLQQTGTLKLQLSHETGGGGVGGVLEGGVFNVIVTLCGG